MVEGQRRVDELKRKGLISRVADISDEWELKCLSTAWAMLFSFSEKRSSSSLAPQGVPFSVVKGVTNGNIPQGSKRSETLESELRQFPALCDGIISIEV